MIEVIYDKNKENEASSDNKEGNRDAKSETIFKLPKNIRQIGTPPSNKRIYIEDYVVTYLNYISRPGSTNARGAILLGECKRTEVGDVIFISGAVDADNLEFDMDESTFTQEAWSAIYEQVKDYFTDLSVVGWFLSRMGFSTAINDKIEKMHVENFPGKDKVLYITDSLENEDAFYLYEKGQLVKQKGYYIYYAKNEQMQNYIVKKRGGIPEEQNTEIHRKDEELIKTYREKNPEKKVAAPKQNLNLAYVAGSFLVLGMLVMGVTLVSNSDKMREMEVSLNRLELTAEGNSGEKYVDAMANSEHGNKDEDNQVASMTDVLSSDTDNVTTETVNENVADNTNTENKSQITTETLTTEKPETLPDKDEILENDITAGTTENIKTEENNITTEQTLPASTGGNATYYTIEFGDSLSSIALKYYGSIIYAEDIARANNLDVDDKIYEGDSIIIPSVKSKE